MQHEVSKKICSNTVTYIEVMIDNDMGIYPPVVPASESSGSPHIEMSTPAKPNNILFPGQSHPSTKASTSRKLAVPSHANAPTLAVSQENEDHQISSDSRDPEMMPPDVTHSPTTGTPTVLEHDIPALTYLPHLDAQAVPSMPQNGSKTTSCSTPNEYL